MDIGFLFSRYPHASQSENLRQAAGKDDKNI
jgi:hypothetical protein